MASLVVITEKKISLSVTSELFDVLARLSGVDAKAICAVELKFEKSNIQRPRLGAPMLSVGYVESISLADAKDRAESGPVVISQIVP